MAIWGRERPIRSPSSSWVQPKSFEQLLIGVGLFQRVQLSAVQVLQQRVPEQVIVAGLADDRGDREQAGTARCPPPALAHDQFEGFAVVGDRDRAHDHWLENSDLAQRVGELVELVVVEHRARVAGVLPHLVDRDLGELGSRHAHQAPVVRSVLLGSGVGSRRPRHGLRLCGVDSLFPAGLSPPVSAGAGVSSAGSVRAGRSG